MCLEYVSETFNPPLKEIGVGWKVFYTRRIIRWKRRRGEMIPVLIPLARPRDWSMGKSRKKGVWLRSTEGMIGGNFRYYPAGFHIFASKKAALRAGGCSATSSAEVLKVRYSHVVAKGTQFDGKKVIVARRMYIYKRGGK